MKIEVANPQDLFGFLQVPRGITVEQALNSEVLRRLREGEEWQTGDSIELEQPPQDYQSTRAATDLSYPFVGLSSFLRRKGNFYQINTRFYTPQSGKPLLPLDEELRSAFPTGTMFFKDQGNNLRGGIVYVEEQPIIDFSLNLENYSAQWADINMGTGQSIPWRIDSMDQFETDMGIYHERVLGTLFNAALRTSGHEDLAKNHLPIVLSYDKPA